MTHNPCFIIPVYNHDIYLEQIINTLKTFNVPCFLVNDGSTAACSQMLEQLAAKHADWVTLLNLAVNSGKGAAVCKGLLIAYTQGYSHALQIDADGQHDLSYVAPLLAAAQQQPEHVICGIPEYDASVPKGRLYGRYLTHFWVWVHTLSFTIKDSMCGFRVYPLAACQRLLSGHQVGARMDFDTDIIVRLYWQGAGVTNLPVKVTYPEDGVSHFRMWQDNALISWMHCKLFFGMLARLPLLLWRKCKAAQA